MRATHADLRALEQRLPGISKTALAATALAMARELDDRDNPASGMAACSRVLIATVAELRSQAQQACAQDPSPPDGEKDGEKEDGVDQLAAKRAARLAET